MFVVVNDYTETGIRFLQLYGNTQQHAFQTDNYASSS